MVNAECNEFQNIINLIVVVSAQLATHQNVSVCPIMDQDSRRKGKIHI